MWNKEKNNINYSYKFNQTVGTLCSRLKNGRQRGLNVIFRACQCKHTRSKGLDSVIKLRLLPWRDALVLVIFLAAVRNTWPRTFKKEEIFWLDHHGRKTWYWKHDLGSNSVLILFFYIIPFVPNLFIQSGISVHEMMPPTFGVALHPQLKLSGNILTDTLEL